MTQDILITPGSGEPQILFRGSGTNDTPIELNVLSSYQSATGSGTALVFEGQEGQLFAVTDNLSSGVIFSVGDITGLSMLSVDASGDVKLGEFANSVIVYPGLTLDDNVPSTTSNVLYNDGGDLMWNGVTVIQSGAAQAVDGSGTASYVARFTDVNTLGTGVIYDNGTNVGIGTAAPFNLLDVNGIVSVGHGNSVGGLTEGIRFVRTNDNARYQSIFTASSAVDYGNRMEFRLHDAVGGDTQTTVMTLRGDDVVNIDGSLGVGIDNPSQTVDIRYPAGGGMALLKSTDTTDGLLFGDMAYSFNNNFQGIKHTAMTGNEDYMILSEGTNTYISAKSGGITVIAAGGNDVNSEIRLTSTEVVVNENSSSRDFRVESNNDANALFVDGVADNVGIGTASPVAKLDVSGDINVSTGQGFRINNTATTGQYLRGNGTRFVSSSIQAGDVPTLNQNTTGSANTISSSLGFTSQPGNGKLSFRFALVSTTAGIFPVSNNSNAIITLNRHPGDYYSQLGFSSNGNLYYRAFSNTAIDTTTAWQTIWTSTSLTNLNQLTNGPGYTTNTGTVTSVASLTLGTTGTDVSSTVTNGTTTPVITLNIPTASASNRGALSSTDWVAFNAKQAAITGGATTITSSNLTASRALVSDGSGKVVVSDITSTELNYLDNASSNIQTQLNSKTGGTGTTGKIPKWSSTTALTDSIMSESSTVVNIAGSLNGQSDDSYLSFDANSNRVGITKKGGFFSKFTYGSAAEFAIAQSNATNILPTGTFTDRFIITSNGTIRFPGLTSNGFLKTGSSNGTLSVDTTSYQTLLTNPVTGTGTTNYVSKWTSNSAQGNSLIFDNGTNVGIGTTSPQQKLHIDEGNIRIEKTIDPTLEFYTGSANRASMFYDTSEETFVLNHADADANQLVLTSGNNVGIGTNDPNATLHVYSAASGDNVFNVEGTNGSLFGVTDNLSGVLMSVNTIAGLPVLEVNSDYSLTAGRFNQNDFVISSGGNIGIGTTNPGYKLEVNGTFSVEEAARFRSTINAQSLGAGTDNTVLILDSSDNIRYDEIDGRVWGSDLVDGAGTTNYVSKWSNADTIANSQIFDNGTNVGIGTASPSAKLHIVSDNPNLKIFDSESTIRRASIEFGNAGGTWSIVHNNNLVIANNGPTQSITLGCYINLGRINDPFIIGERGIERLRIVNGNLGIGTTSPQQKLHVVGDQRIQNATDPKLEFHDGAAVGAYVKFDTSEDNLVLSHVDVAGDNQIALANDGNVGIGTASPNAVLHAYGSTPSGTVFNVEGTNGSLFSVVDNLSGVLMSVNNNAGLPVFEVNDDDSIVAGRFAQNDFVVTTSGDIGMGTANPSSKLEVNGTVTATSFSGAGTGLTGTAASLTAGAVTNGVYTTGNQTVGGVKTFSSQIINTRANSTSTGGGQIYLNGATGNRIDFNTNGVAAPSFTTRSAGTKLVLFPSVSANTADYALGIESSTLWSSIPNTTSTQFKWYAGTTNIATLTGAGVLTVAGSTSQINVDNLRLDGNTLSSTNTNGNVIITPNGTGALQADSGGNARGAYAVDLQRFRSNAAQVASGACSTISGGRSNTASGTYSTVGGGYINRACGSSSTVGGGFGHTASGSYSTVSGGSSNTACGSNSTVSGGYDNRACGTYSAVGGGISNTACGSCSTVGGGGQNFVNARHGSINGGHYNVIQSPTNECSSRGATIGGGIGHNTTGGTFNFTTGDITGTVTCCNAGPFSTIGGGFRNKASAFYSTVSGGRINTACGSTSTVSGGLSNTASGYYSTVGGGDSNTASGYYSIVSGGRSNAACGSNSTVSGGYGNTACETLSAVGGGGSNTASGYSSTVSGGQNNTASGSCSTVSGGYNNTASGSYSTLGGGIYAKASRYGEVAHAAGRFAANGDAQHSTFVARKNTTDATANVELFLDGVDDRMILTAETTWTFDIKLSAYNDTDNTTAWWIIRGGIRRNAANSTTLIGSLIEERDYEGTMSGTSAAVTADDTNESLKIAVTGLASKNIRWVAVVDVAQVSWGTP
jgi:hypothetical protein